MAVVLAIPRRRHGALHHGRASRNGKLRWEPATPEHAALRWDGGKIMKPLAASCRARRRGHVPLRMLRQRCMFVKVKSSKMVKRKPPEGSGSIWAHHVDPDESRRRMELFFVVKAVRDLHSSLQTTTSAAPRSPSLSTHNCTPAHLCLVSFCPCLERRRRRRQPLTHHLDSIQHHQPHYLPQLPEPPCKPVASPLSCTARVSLPMPELIASCPV
jgi:hypothetical protein